MLSWLRRDQDKVGEQLMATYVVTELGPIDRHAPGTDVTRLYDAATLARLVEEGYVEDIEAANASETGEKWHTKARKRKSS